MTLQPGDFVQLLNGAAPTDQHTYQVVSIDEFSERCWVRRWPLTHQGSPSFSVSLDRVRQPSLTAG